MSAASPAPTRADYPRLADATVVVQSSDGLLCAGARVPGGVLTAAHCAPPGVSLWVEDRQGHQADVEGIRSDPGHDLALLTVPGLPSEPALRLRRSELGELAWGERVVAAGHPSGLRWTVHEGLASGSTIRHGHVQVRVGIAPGFSGGPVVDERGDLCGVVSGIYVAPLIPGIGVGDPDLGMISSVADTRSFLQGPSS